MTVEMVGRVRSPVKPGMMDGSEPGMMDGSEPGMMGMADQVGHDVDRPSLPA